MHKLISGLVLAMAIGSAGGAASAEPMFAQLRFQITPNGADAVWSTPGVKFEKKGECAYMAATRAVATWPQRVAPLASGQATAPLFNPGFAKPDGSYVPNSADDGFNTLFYAVEPAAGAASVVCRGSILANGADVTADKPGRVAAATAAHIGQYGPLTVAPELDAAKLAKVTSGGTNTAANGGIKLNQPPVLQDRGGTVTFINNRYDLESGYSEGDGPGGNTSIPSSVGPRDLKQFGMHDQVTLAPLPGAKYSNAGVSMTARGYLRCNKAGFPGNSPNVVKPGEYYCLKTVEGNLAEIKITSLEQPSYADNAPYRIDFTYTLWNTPPVVLTKASAVLNTQDTKLDVETGAKGSGIWKGETVSLPYDLWLEGIKDSVSLRAVSGAQYATSEPTSAASGYAGCNARNYSSATPKAYAGKFYCLRTSDGHLVEYGVTKIAKTLDQPGAPYAVFIDYTVWK